MECLKFITEENSGKSHSRRSTMGSGDAFVRKPSLPHKSPINKAHDGLTYLSLESVQNSQRQLIGIRGLWYDIAKFVPHHPGGPIIQQFVGKDATAVYSVMHMHDVVRNRRPVAYYHHHDEEQGTFLRLYEHMLRNGYFQSDPVWYAKKIVVAVILLVLTIQCLTAGPNIYVRLLGGIFLAGFWQQCGFFMHDAEHNQITHHAKMDRILGTFFGTLCLGIDGSWWKREHHIHHALTNTVDHKTGFVDPQMHENCWAQNQLLFPFVKSKFEKWCVSVQHIAFIPVCVFLGRPAIIIDAMSKERNLWEWLAFTVHCSLIGYLFSYVPSWPEILLIYFIASSLQGILHVQLLLNHYAEPFVERDQVCNTKNWFRMQIENNTNIECPVYLDWFHGGLNLHIEHHLFPNMPRHNFRKAQVLVKQLCKELDIEYKEMPVSSAVVKVVKHLKTCGHLFSLDPR